MPASRSRTDNWRESLRKVYERGGALEISVDRGLPIDGREDNRGSDLVWRVKILSMTETTIVVEPPAAFGASIPLSIGVRLVGAMTVGQNRWMFHTTVKGFSPGARGMRCAVLTMPEAVERCSRRSFFRSSTADLRLPMVQCWPLLDPSSIAAPEAANRGQISDLMNGSGPTTSDVTNPEGVLLPEVGPMFNAHLLNVSGGGLGLLLSPDDSRALHSRPFLWLRVDLRPEIPAPVAMTCRAAHTHMDSSQKLYAGLAFDFSHNPEHRKFIMDLFGVYAEAVQARQQTEQRDAA